MDSEEYAAAFVVYYILSEQKNPYLHLKKDERSGLNNGFEEEMSLDSITP